jgi:hypothetical protein
VNTRDRFPEPALIRSEASRERLLPDRAVVEVVVVEVLHLEDALQRGVPGGDALQQAEVPEPIDARGMMISRSAALAGAAAKACTVPGGTTARSPSATVTTRSPVSISAAPDTT